MFVANNIAPPSFIKCIDEEAFSVGLLSARTDCAIPAEYYKIKRKAESTEFKNTKSFNCLSHKTPTLN